MKNIQELFDELEIHKKEQKELKSMYAGALKNNLEYQKIRDEIDTLKARRKQIEEGIRSDFTSEFSRLDSLKLEIEDKKVLMSDAAISKLMSNETVEVKDERENRYEPVFSVKFIKV